MDDETLANGYFDLPEPDLKDVFARPLSTDPPLTIEDLEKAWEELTAKPIASEARIGSHGALAQLKDEYDIRAEREGRLFEDPITPPVWGIPIIVDESLPPDLIEIRDADGSVMASIRMRSTMPLFTPDRPFFPQRLILDS